MVDSDIKIWNGHIYEHSARGLPKETKNDSRIIVFVSHLFFRSAMGSLHTGGWESVPEQGKETLLQLLCFSDPQVSCACGKDVFFLSQDCNI